MQISIRYFTTLREITGKKEEKLCIENQKFTISLALKILSDRYGKPFINYVFDSSEMQVKKFIQVLINGANIDTLNGQETLLQEGDILAILPPVGGG